MTACYGVVLSVVSSITLCQILIVTEAQPCTMGFPATLPTESQCTNGCGIREAGGSAITRIIPDMNFTCTGNVIEWRAAGVFNSGGQRDIDAMLGIWRETSDDPKTYTRMANIKLGICGNQVPAPSASGVYECTLPENQKVLVQPGDIVGIEIARNGRYRFRLYFNNTNGGPTNYVFDGQVSTFAQTQLEARSTEQDQPQISLTVEPIISTTTTQPLTTTQASATDLPTTPSPTTEASSTAATPQSLTTTRASTTAAAVTTTGASTESTTISINETPITSNARITQTPITTMADAPTTTVNDPPTTMSDSTTTDSSATAETPRSTTVDAVSNMDGRVTEQLNTSNTVGTIAGAAVGGIIAILLVLIILLLLVLVLRRQSRSGQKFAPQASTIVNPVYDDNIAVQMPNPIAGQVGVYAAVGADHAPADYEDIDDAKPTIPPSDMFNFVESMNDYSRTPLPIEMSTYEVPVQTLAKDSMPPRSFADAGMLYVPSQEQRNSLSKNGTNGDVYSTIGMRQYSESGAAPMLFEEDDTYWEPASDANELYKQLSAKKYREIVRKQIQITAHLGSGQFGTVNRGIWQSPMGAMDVAVKQLQSGASEEDKVKFLQEAAINGQFRHPNVVKLMGVVTVGEPTMIVLEMLSNGDLHNYLLKLRPSPGEILPSNTQQLLLKFCQQVASGMDYLARKAFVHRDLAARNILVADDKTCKISDFGMSRDLMDENYYVSHGGKVPVKWTAPEAIHYKKYSTASDVWSYGCVMYEIWSLGHKPFEAYRNAEVITMIDDGYRLPPPPGLPKELYKIMIQCWHPERSNRPTFPQLVEMLSRADFELFVWEEEDFRNSDPQVKLIGVPLETAKDLYHELQRTYLSS